ncbi:MAG: hypothetical protein F4X55_05630 [Candidatus Dadabacteria bacterium]|nr:hypothetical protein [Candidatus Dadabacteria bacterium]MYC40475.1 hypothetical protein [Candidatus Dadabacteria bacterium]
MRNIAIAVLIFMMGTTMVGCGDDSNATSEPVSKEPVKMTAFFATITNGNDVCESLDLDFYFDEDPVAGLEIGKPNIRILRSGETVENATYGHIGIDLGNVLTTAYVLRDQDGNFATPGSTYVMTRIDTDISQEEIYTGLWVGQAVRTPGNPLVICPVVLIPEGTVGKDACGMSPTDVTGMDEGLSKYLLNEDGTLNTCKSFLKDGVFSY